MTGIEMMLKSMGVDPNAIKTSLTTARDEIMAQVSQINAKLDNIEEKLNQVLYPIKSSEEPVHEGGSIDGIEEQPNTLKEQLQQSLLKVQ